MAMTITENRLGSMKMIKAVWTIASSSSGAASGTTTYTYDGKIQGLATSPGAGSLAPSASYDITCSNTSSIDILFGGGLNRAAAAKEYVVAASLGAVTGAEGTLTFKVTNAGASTAGTIYLYAR